MRENDAAFVSGIVVGIGLIVLGIGSYVATDFASVTALIPAIAGALFAGLGVAGRRTDRKRRALVGLAVLSLLGFAGTLRMLPDAIALVTGGAVDSAVAAAANGLMAVGCLVVLVASAYALVAAGR